jgi:hypothetical protein
LVCAGSRAVSGPYIAKRQACDGGLGALASLSVGGARFGEDFTIKR